jgi:hypothetical protein
VIAKYFCKACNEVGMSNCANFDECGGPELISKCNIAPEGWSCSLVEGHKGPCAAWPLFPEGWQFESSISNEHRAMMWKVHSDILKQGYNKEADALSKALLACLPPMNLNAS